MYKFPFVTNDNKLKLVESKNNKKKPKFSHCSSLEDGEEKVYALYNKSVNIYVYIYIYFLKLQNGKFRYSSEIA